MIKNVVAKYTREITIVGLLILLLSVWTCSHNAQKVAQGETKQLKEQLKHQKDGVDVFRKQQKILFDSLSAENTKKDRRISELQETNRELTKKSSENLKKLKDKQKQIASYDKKQSAEYLNVYFQGLDAIPTEKSVNLENNLPNLVVGELEEKQFLEKEVVLKDSIIENKDEEIKLGNEKLLNKDLALASKQIEVDKLDGVTQIQEYIIKKSDRQISNLKTKNFITTYILPPLVFIGGVYVGTKVVK